MTIREVAALVLLYHACKKAADSFRILGSKMSEEMDAAIRRSEKLAPGMQEFAETVVPFRRN